MPQVSVIIPVYNRPGLVVEAIESVATQTFNDLEILVVDDGSTDGTAEAVNNCGTTLRYFRQENLGPAVARNLGIKNSQSEYIAFLDSDDLWKSDKLARQVDYLTQNREYLICHTNEIWLRDNKLVNQKKYHRKGGGNLYCRSLSLCLISPSAVLLRKELLDQVGLFDQQMMVCEDYDLWLRVTSRFPVGYIDSPLVIKRGGDWGQLSCQYPAMDRFRVRSLLKIITRGDLDDSDLLATLAVLSSKANLLSKGYAVRGHVDEANLYSRVAMEAEGYLAAPESVSGLISFLGIL